jgi:uncharacterized protein YegL
VSSVTDITDRLRGHRPFADQLPDSVDSAELRSAFPNHLYARWLHCCRRLLSAGFGDLVFSAYVRYAPIVSKELNPEIALDLTDSISAIAAKTGRLEAAKLPQAAAIAAKHLKNERSYRAWINLIERFAAIAPESTLLLLDQIDILLSSLSVSRLEAWILAGIRLSGGDPNQRAKFFSFENPESNRWLLFESESIGFSSMAPRLRMLMRALWGLGPPLREPTLNTNEKAKRRSSFGLGVVRLPTSFPGFQGEHAEDLYRACIAHIGAHIHFSGPKFPIRKLKPIQVAVISLIEDARVENLALREMPGLRRLWLPLHVAQTPSSLSPNHALMAPNLLARLARALIDPDFSDYDGWVKKARSEFFSQQDSWGDPQFSRELGGLLGNDLGQMRVGWQFDIGGYVVEPPYRDDNLGLWDFGEEQMPPDSLEAEHTFDSVRLQQQLDDDSTPPDQERQEIEQNEDTLGKPVKLEVSEAEGVPVARYPEFDYMAGYDRPDWTTLVEYSPPAGNGQIIENAIDQSAEVLNRITSLIKAAKVSRPKRTRRLPEGEYLDLDACIDARINQRAGLTPDPRVYGQWVRQDRDLSVLLLLDISESTRDVVANSTQTVLDLEVQASALLAHAMAGLGDPFGISAFCSNNREDVRYFRIKDFDEPFQQRHYSNLAGLESGLSTRMGAAIRHAGADLSGRSTYRKLLLLVTDGEPSDLDIKDPRYLIEDARRSVQSLSHQGIDVFCVGLETKTSSYLDTIFGPKNSVVIDRIEKLPEKLPQLFLRMTG